VQDNTCKVGAGRNTGALCCNGTAAANVSSNCGGAGACKKRVIQ